LFKRQPRLLDSPYQVKSRVSTSSFREFLSAVNNQPVDISESNYGELSQLCQEFEFSGLDPSFSSFDISRRFSQTEHTDLVTTVAEFESERGSQSRAPKLPFDSLSFLRTFQKRFDDYEEIVLLGEGVCAKCILVCQCSSGEQFALLRPKIDFICHYFPRNERDRARRTTLPLIVNLPHLVPTVGFCVNGGQFGLLTSFFRNGTLAAAVYEMQKGEPRAGFGPTQLSKCIFGIARTMARFHSRGAIHRNLILKHVFLDDQFEPVLGCSVLSKIVTDRLKMAMGLGTPISMAPELFDENQVYGNPVDVYAFAVLIYQLFSRSLTFEDGTPVRAPEARMKVARGLRFERRPEIPESFWCLITVCWHQDPTVRPTFAEIVEQLEMSPDLVFPGTNMNEYREYQERLGNEGLEDPRSIDLVDALYSITGWSRIEDEEYDNDA
jgi:serine/threonine protein kinase